MEDTPYVQHVIRTLQHPAGTTVVGKPTPPAMPQVTMDIVGMYVMRFWQESTPPFIPNKGGKGKGTPPIGYLRLGMF